MEPEPLELDDKRGQGGAAPRHSLDGRLFDKRLVAWLTVVGVLLFVFVPFTVIVADRRLTEPAQLTILDVTLVYEVRHAALWVSALNGELHGPGLQVAHCVSATSERPSDNRCTCDPSDPRNSESFVRNFNAMDAGLAPVYLHPGANCTDGYTVHIALTPRWYMMLLAVLVSALFVSCATFVCCFKSTTCAWCFHACCKCLPAGPSFTYQRVNRELGYYGAVA